MLNLLTVAVSHLFLKFTIPHTCIGMDVVFFFFTHLCTPAPPCCRASLSSCLAMARATTVFPRPEAPQSTTRRPSPLLMPSITRYMEQKVGCRSEIITASNTVS